MAEIALGAVVVLIVVFIAVYGGILINYILDSLKNP